MGADVERLARHILISYIPKAVEVISLAITIKIVTTQLDETDYGLYSFSVGTLGFFCFLGGVGLHRYMSVHIPGASRPRQYALLRHLMRLEVLVLTALAVVCSVLLPLWLHHVGQGEHSLPVVLLLWSGLFWQIYNEYMRFFGLQKRLGLKCFLASLYRPAIIMLMAIAIIALGRLSLSAALGCVILANVLCWLITRSFHNAPPAHETAEQTSHLPGFRDIYGFLVVFYLIDITWKVKDWLPRLLIADFVDLAHTGFYALSFNYTRLFLIAVTSISDIIFIYNVSYAKRLAAGDISAGPTFRRLLRANVMLTGTLFVAGALIGNEYKRDVILLLSRPEFVQCARYVPLHLLAVLVYLPILWLQPLAPAMVDIRRLRKHYVGLLVLFLLLSTILTYTAGVYGAIISVIVVFTVWSLLLIKVMRHHLSFVFRWSDLFGLLGSSAILAALVYAFAAMPVNRWALLVLTCITCCGIVCWLRREEIRVLLRYREDADARPMD